MAMLGDAGSDALDALLGCRSVGRVRGAARWLVIGGLATLATLGKRLPLDGRPPVFARLDRWGRLDP
jgi:hypothetical protein